jgi:hypothetical protein
MLSVSRRVRNWSFALLLAVLVGSGTVQNVLASGCGTIHYSPDGIWYWSCGWYSNDPCTDGTAANTCDNDCYSAFGPSVHGNLYSCYATGGDGQYYWSSADCGCS